MRVGASAALSAACAIAAVHYYFILQCIDEFSKNGTTKNFDHLRVRDMRVDGLRYSDWLITLPLLTIEISLLRSDFADTIVSGYWLALLQAVMVSLGAVWRFVADEGRTLQRRILGYVSFVASILLLVVVLIFLLMHSLTWISTFNDKESVKNDIAAVQILTLVWIAYPLAAGVTGLSQPANGGRQDYGTRHAFTWKARCTPCLTFFGRACDVRLAALKSLVHCAPVRGRG